MKRYPIVFSIAGSDPSGGAGIQSDLKTIAALGGYGAAAITALTIQNTRGVKEVYPVSADVVSRQILAVCEDLCPDVVKIGMVATLENVGAIAGALRRFRPSQVVYDPVLASTAGQKLIRDEVPEALRAELFPLCTLITPNLDEAERLTGLTVRNEEQMQQAGRRLQEQGCSSVLIKGGHLTGKEMTDLLFTPEQMYRFSGPKIDSGNLHGTGCTLSSAIATYIALGHPLPDAVGKAKSYLTQAIQAGQQVRTGHGNGPVCHSSDPVKMVVL
ncbi:MAG: bifunctional hydroxymethylpyrimidine kinase/phosphomethylpyrimidine kinase [Bacteroides sp.]|nr:bifunctional hydroxymethylpyrimidine kinase/phosphomethylpyrimidine kinase [Bacteroides sp.]